MRDFRFLAFAVVVVSRVFLWMAWGSCMPACFLGSIKTHVCGCFSVAVVGGVGCSCDCRNLNYHPTCSEGLTQSCIFADSFQKASGVVVKISETLKCSRTLVFNLFYTLQICCGERQLCVLYMSTNRKHTLFSDSSSCRICVDLFSRHRIRSVSFFASRIPIGPFSCAQLLRMGALTFLSRYSSRIDSLCWILAQPRCPPASTPTHSPALRANLILCRIFTQSIYPAGCGCGGLAKNFEWDCPPHTESTHIAFVWMMG